MDFLLNNLDLGFGALILCICSAAIFLPFVRKATGKSILQCSLWSVGLQAILLLGYVLLFFIVGYITPAPQHKPLHAVFLPMFLCGLFTVVPVSTIAGKVLLSLKSGDQFKTLLVGNLVASSIVWFALWLSPL